MNTMPLLEIKDLTVTYPQDYLQGRREFKALDQISITLNVGQIIGIVGESGAGKSTIGKAILGLLDPPAKILNGKNKLLP